MVGVAAPAVEDVSGVGVEIDEPADFGEGVEYPFDVFCFWLGESGGTYNFSVSDVQTYYIRLSSLNQGLTMKSLRRRTSRSDRRSHAGRKESCEIPEEIKITIKIDTNRCCSTRR